MKAGSIGSARVSSWGVLSLWIMKKEKMKRLWLLLLRKE